MQEFVVPIPFSSLKGSYSFMFDRPVNYFFSIFRMQAAEGCGFWALSYSLKCFVYWALSSFLKCYTCKIILLFTNHDLFIYKFMLILNLKYTLIQRLHINQLKHWLCRHPALWKRYMLLQMSFNKLFMMIKI